MIPTRRALVIASLAVAFWASAAHAGERYALVVGANIGNVDDGPLAYAERDAQRVAEVLTRLGGVAPENLLLLLGPDSGALERALASFAARVEQSGQAGQSTEEASDGPVLFVYYSGHADAQSLHLRGTSLAFRNLRAAVDRIDAEVSIFILDACRSGGIVRKKGATPAEPFEIRVEDEMRSSGLAIITSSSESEDAQESERLGGGVFTHHLVTGLVGAADTSGDQRVTLSEAYRYAYAQTLHATSTTAVVQHPTYAFDLSGERELVLTRIESASGLGRLRLADPGSYIVFERFGSHEVAAELTARAGTELVLVPGTYLVRRRETARVWEKEVKVKALGQTDLAAHELSAVPYRHAVRKGYGQAERSALSVGADLEMTGPILPETGAVLLGAVTVQLDLADLALRARLRYGRSWSDSSGIALQQGVLGADIGLYKLFDLGPHGVGFGLRGGVDWLSQSFDTTGDAPDRNQVTGRLGPVVRTELALTSTIALTLDLGAEAWIVEEAQADGTTRVGAEVVPLMTLGVGILLP